MKLPRHAGAVLRLAICAALLVYLARRLDFSTLGQVLSRTAAHWPWWVAAIGFTFLGLAVGALRWKEILTAQGLRLTFGRVFQIFFVGQFFNAFMLGACGGDVARAYYASRDTPGKRAEAISTVFVDRAVGLFATVVFCCAMIVLRVRLFLDLQGTRWPGILMFAFLAAGVAALVALFRRNLFEHWGFFRRLEQDTRLGPLMRRAYEAFYLYRTHHRVMAVALALSMLNLAFLTLACYSFGQSLEIALRMVDYFTLFPIISVLAAVPITPGGLGVREGLFVAMFQDLEVDPHHALPLSLMVYVGGLVWSLFGGLLFLGYTVAPGHALRDEIEAVKQSQSG